MSCRFSLVWSSLLIAALLAGCAGKTPRVEQCSVPGREALELAPLTLPGLHPVSEDEAQRIIRHLSPAQQGMGSWQDMAFAVRQSLAHASAKPASRVAISTPYHQITYGEMARSLERLLHLLPFLDKAPEVLASDFRWLRVGPDFGFTGYYEPEIVASTARKGRFQYPLYRVPPSDRLKRLDRHSIDCKGGLRGKGLELAWVENPVDIFMLQIQGSGRLRFEDGTVRQILYAGQNGRKYVSLGRVMVDRGYLQREDVSMFSIRKWLAEHPDQVTELLDTNPSYVFFKLGKPGREGSYGSMGRVLTPWVSAATDQSVLPNGLLTLMNLSFPDESGEHAVPFTGLMLPQDTGGAIKRNRVDVFCGNGEKAVRTASYLDTGGAVFVLLPR